MNNYARLLGAMGVAALAPGTILASAASMPVAKNDTTYREITLFMSALPLLLIGGMIYWLWRRYS